jgi:hypothetical protein
MNNNAEGSRTQSANRTRKVDGTLDCSQQPEWEYLRGSGRGLVRVLGADIHHECVQLTW